MTCVLGKVLSVGHSFCYPVCHLCSFQCRLRDSEAHGIRLLRCSRCKGCVDAQRARYRFAVTLRVMCDNDEMAVIVIFGKKLNAMFGSSADEIMRVVSKFKFSSDHVHAVLEECFVGLWFHFSLSTPQGRTGGAPGAGIHSYISHCIRPVSTVEKNVMQLLTDARRQCEISSLSPQLKDMSKKETSSAVKSNDESLPETMCQPATTRSSYEDLDESLMLSTWHPSQANTQLEVEPYLTVKETSWTRTEVETCTSDVQSSNNETDMRRVSFICSLSDYHSFSLDDSVAHLLSMTLDISDAQEVKPQKNVSNTLLSSDHSHLTVTPGSLCPYLGSESDNTDNECSLSDVGKGQHSWVMQFNDPAFCKNFFSPLHQECSEPKQPEEWRQDQQVGCPISRLALNIHDRILTSGTAASNSLPSGCQLAQSQTPGSGLWSGSELASCLEIEPSYQHGHFKDLSKDSLLSVLSPLCVSTPLHLAKKSCVRTTPTGMRSWSKESDCGSPLLFSESESNSFRTECEFAVNCGGEGSLVESCYTPDLFSQ